MATAAAAVVLAPPAATYQDFYDDPAHDPFLNRHPEVLEKFSAPLAGAAPAIRDGVLSNAASGRPVSLLLLSRDNATDNVGKVRLYHRVQRYTPSFVDVTQWDDQVFAFLGDLVAPANASSIVTVHLDEATGSPFGPTNSFRIPEATLADASLAAAAPPDLLGPYNAQDADTTVVRVRKVMFCPAPYVRLILKEALSPMEAYTRFKAAITADGAEVGCARLLEWLRAAMTMQQANTISPVASDKPLVPQIDATLIQHRLDIVTRDLPALTPSVVTQGAQAIAAGLNDLVAEQRQTRQSDEAARQKQEQPKSVDDYFGDVGTTRLLRLCQVPTSNLLPPLYAAFAAAPKQQLLNVLQDAFDQELELVPVSTVPCVLTPALLQKVLKGQWAMAQRDDLSHGINPFLLGYRAPAEREAQQHRANFHQLILEGSASPSLADATMMLAPDTVQIPTNLPEVRASLSHFTALSAVALGAHHPNTQALSTLLQDLNQQEIRLQETLAGAARGDLAPSIIRFVQWQWNAWAERQLRTNRPVALDPRVAQLAHLIDSYQPWEVPFPLRYHRILPITPAPAPPPSGPSPARPSLPPAPATSPRPPAPPSTPAPVLPPPTSGTRIINLAYDERFRPFRDVANLPTRTMYTRATAPGGPGLPTRTINGQAQDRCLAYHVRGMCNSNCSRAHDHNQTASGPEAQQLFDWCQAHWRA